jgi:hypothetical protein
LLSFQGDRCYGCLSQAMHMCVVRWKIEMKFEQRRRRGYIMMAFIGATGDRDCIAWLYSSIGDALEGCVELQ